MLTRHVNQLMEILEGVSKQGWGFIEWWKLRLWYGVEKLKKEPYRDIAARWEELVGDDKALRAMSTPSGLLLLGEEPLEFSVYT